MKRRHSSIAIALLSLGMLAALPLAAQIQVDSASPSAAPQGTVNLDVVITGNGFKRGAVAQWFVTGTTNPGGITVNSTTVKGASQITANITVAPDAVVSGFDIVVRNTDGRTGKGTDKFAVTLKGTPIGCTTTGTPAGFSLATVLNPVQPDGAALITTGTLGNAISTRPVDLNRDGVVDTLLAFVVSGGYQTGVTYLFLLDPVTGKMQTTNPLTGAAWQNPMTLLTGLRGTQAEAGDVNGDGVPDFLIANTDTTAYLFVGSLSGAPAYTISYTSYALAHPATAPGYWQIAAAMGDLDGDGMDEIVLGARPVDGQLRHDAAAGIVKNLRLHRNGLAAEGRRHQALDALLDDETGHRGSARDLQARLGREPAAGLRGRNARADRQHDPAVSRIGARRAGGER